MSCQRHYPVGTNFPGALRVLRNAPWPRQTFVKRESDHRSTEPIASRTLADRLSEPDFFFCGLQGIRHQGHRECEICALARRPTGLIARTSLGCDPSTPAQRISSQPSRVLRCERRNLRPKRILSTLSSGQRPILGNVRWENSRLQQVSSGHETFITTQSLTISSSPTKMLSLGTSVFDR